MKRKLFFLVIFCVFFFEIGFVSSAHFIIGRLNDALDGTSANDHTVVLWNPLNGLGDNLTDIVGPNGNSGQNNIYMIDCELLSTPCEIGDIMSIQVLEEAGKYFTVGEVNVTVTGAGFDLANNLTLNSPPSIDSIFVDDSTHSPANEIDLLAANSRQVYCVANITEFDSDSIINVNASFFDSGYSFDTPDDNNYHYLNQSCNVDSDFGNENQSQINCSFEVFYYANPGSWTCQIVLEDENSASKNDTDTTSVNELLAVGLIDSVDFGVVNLEEVSSELVLNVTNYGNVLVNLSLSGYGSSEGDNLSMDCLSGNITVGFIKYNLTDSVGGTLNYTHFSGNYTNLTSSPYVNEFNINYRQDDTENEAIDETYWRTYVPDAVAGTCSGTIVFGAVEAVAS